MPTSDLLTEYYRDLIQRGAASPPATPETPTTRSQATQLQAEILLPADFLAPTDQEITSHDGEDNGVGNSGNRHLSTSIDDDVQQPPAGEISATIEYDPPLGQWLDNGRPAWAEAEFDVLILRVAGLAIAVPLLLLGQIQPIDDELGKVFGQSPWFLGIQPTNFGSINVLDTHFYITNKPIAERPDYLVTIDQLNWGIGFDEAEQPLRLDPSAVRWRGKRDQQSWMAGILKQQLCPLVDIAALGKILNQS